MIGILKNIWTNFILFYLKLALEMLNLPAVLYDLIFSHSITKRSYQFMLQNTILPKLNQIKTILDIGVGTGVALKSILPSLEGVKIVGIDIHRNYIQKAQNLLKDFSNVQIRYQDFYEFNSKKSEKFDMILFGSSFMLLPDRHEALRIAKEILNPNGSIMFLLTLYNEKNKLALIESIKPKLKYFTSADFGKVVYENQFKEEMEKGGLQIVEMKRVYQKFNPLFIIFNFYCIECKLISK